MLLFHFCCRLAEEEEEEVGRVDHMQWHVHIYAKSNAQLSIVWYHPVDNAWLITMITLCERFVVVHIFCCLLFFSFFDGGFRVSYHPVDYAWLITMITFF